MNDIKYTTDGKKVVVIGSLNSQEKIVQEIFIVDGSEIPSGEHFVVKSLHDAPAMSWQEKNIKEIKEKYDKEYSYYKNEIDKLIVNYRKVGSEFKNKIEYIKKAVTKISPETFDLLADYVTGNIKYIFDCKNFEILPIEKFNQEYEGKLRLISFFGKDDGSFSYSIGEYYDYSGGNNKFIPCRTEEEAILELTKYIHSECKIYITENAINQAKKYNINIDDDIINEYKQNRIKELENSIKNEESFISKRKEEIERIKQL